MFIKLELMLVGSCLGKSESGNCKIRCFVFNHTGQWIFFSYPIITMVNNAKMEEPYWWYVLFVRTNSERRVVREITDYVKANKFNFEFEAFIPESEYYYRNKKRELWKEYLKRPLFPGYVFIETDLQSQDFLKIFSQIFHNSLDIIKILRYGENGEIAISTEERRRLEYMFKGKRCFEHSQGFIVGDKVIIENGPLIGREGNIKYINRHNRIAKVEFEMFGRSMFADVALEIVKKF